MQPLVYENYLHVSANVGNLQVTELKKHVRIAYKIIKSDHVLHTVISTTAQNKVC
jgi:hypothetical protein